MAKTGWCVWITGLPGSGKSVIAQSLLKKLEERGIQAQIVSSDTMRKNVLPVSKYTEEEREMIYNAIVFVSTLLTQNGVNVIIDATGNRKRYRDLARKNIQKFIEAYAKCPLEVCIRRETQRQDTFNAPKEIYQKGFQRKSATVPGINVPYEETLNPEVVMDADKLTIEQCAEKILEVIERALR